MLKRIALSYPAALVFTGTTYGATQVIKYAAENGGGVAVMVSVIVVWAILTPALSRMYLRILGYS